MLLPCPDSLRGDDGHITITWIQRINNTMKVINLLVASLAAALAVSCSTKVSGVPSLTDALDDSAWDSSEWISVVDAPVITGRISDQNGRAADGASWFVSSLRPSKKVASAK